MDLEFTGYGEGGVHPAVALQGVLAHPAHRLEGRGAGAHQVTLDRLPEELVEADEDGGGEEYGAGHLGMKEVWWMSHLVVKLEGPVINAWLPLPHQHCVRPPRRWRWKLRNASSEI